jgi:opacity protein-like surface antigen
MRSYSYSAGFGMQKEPTPHMQVALGYELFDWGKSSLAPALGKRTDEALVMNH